MAGLSICTSQPLKLQPGQWLIQYTSTSPLKVRTDGGDQVVHIQPSDFFVMIETDALKFLSLIQRRHPALIESFNIITRYAAT